VSSHKFLFLLKSYPDIDHMVPAIWTVLERGDDALLAFEVSYDYRNDFRLQHVLKYPRCRIAQPSGVLSPNRVARGWSRLRWNRRSLRTWLSQHQVDALFVEWGPGVPPRGLRAAIAWRANLWTKESAVRRSVEAAVPELRYALIGAAVDTAIPVIALPHGVSTKSTVDYNPKLTERMKQHGGELPFDDRNCFAAWVFPWQHHRTLTVQHARMRPDIAQTWGSLRFSPEWMTVLREICPPANLPDKGSRLRVVFFLPKWGNRVDQEATVRLIRSLADRDDLQLVLKTHPRKGVSDLSGDVIRELESHGRVVIADDRHSASLVRESDVVIDVGSGMAIDGVLEGKLTLYPSYLHQNKLVFDDIHACPMPADDRALHAILDAEKAGRGPRPQAGIVRRLQAELVFGGVPQRDVPEYYYQRISAILEQHSRDQQP
jgi:hypothetical protein